MLTWVQGLEKGSHCEDQWVSFMEKWAPVPAQGPALWCWGPSYLVRGKETIIMSLDKLLKVEVSPHIRVAL